METVIEKARRLTERDSHMLVSSPEWRSIVRSLLAEIDALRTVAKIPMPPARVTQDVLGEPERPLEVHDFRDYPPRSHVYDGETTAHGLPFKPGR